MPPSNSNIVDIKGLPKGQLLKVLCNNAFSQGIGYVSTGHKISLEEAEAILEEKGEMCDNEELYIARISQNELQISLGGDELDVTEYNRYNRVGHDDLTAQQVIDALREELAVG